MSADRKPAELVILKQPPLKESDATRAHREDCTCNRCNDWGVRAHMRRREFES